MAVCLWYTINLITDRQADRPIIYPTDNTRFYWEISLPIICPGKFKVKPLKIDFKGTIWLNYPFKGTLQLRAPRSRSSKDTKSWPTTHRRPTPATSSGQPRSPPPPGRRWTRLRSGPGLPQVCGFVSAKQPFYIYYLVAVSVHIPKWLWLVRSFAPRKVFL